jgi:hypothetical protein
MVADAVEQHQGPITDQARGIGGEFAYAFQLFHHVPQLVLGRRINDQASIFVIEVLGAFQKFGLGDDPRDINCSVAVVSTVMSLLFKEKVVVCEEREQGRERPCCLPRWK